MCLPGVLWRLSATYQGRTEGSGGLAGAGRSDVARNGGGAEHRVDLGGKRRGREMFMPDSVCASFRP